MKVCIIGTGNVAKSMGAALLKAGHTITGVFGRNLTATKAVARRFKCDAIANIKSLPINSDVYLIAVNDDSIQHVVKSLPAFKGVLAHTSGSVPLQVFGRKKNVGVLYPVDSITGKYNYSFANTPICVEAENEAALKKLMQLASSISDKIFLLNSNERAHIHVAAVFTNNFTNHLLDIATGLIDNFGLPRELLQKLAQTTIHNAFSMGPKLAQTGPAKRNDRATINKHLKFLNKNPELKVLYQLFTNQISNVHNKVK